MPNDPADQALEMFSATGHKWQDRAQQPPPYTPTAQQVKDLWRELLEQCVAENRNHAANRYLRVRRTTPLVSPRDAQQFALEVEAPAGWAVCALVDAGGAFAEKTVAPDELVPRSVLAANVRDLRTELADTPPFDA